MSLAKMASDLMWNYSIFFLYILYSFLFPALGDGKNKYRQKTWRKLSLSACFPVWCCVGQLPQAEGLPILQPPPEQALSSPEGQQPPLGYLSCTVRWCWTKFVPFCYKHLQKQRRWVINLCLRNPKAKFGGFILGMKEQPLKRQQCSLMEWKIMQPETFPSVRWSHGY